MKMAKAIRQQAITAERVAANTVNTFVAGQMKSLAQAFRSQAEIIKKNKKKKKNEFLHGDLFNRRKTPEAALKKAREMSRTGCYDISITTPEGREYHSSEFADLPGTPVTTERPIRKTPTSQKPGPIPRLPR
jgi:hypothetical protein